MESLCIVGVDNHGLGTGVFVDGVAGDRFGLCDYHGAGNAGNGDLTFLIRPVQAGGGQRAALGIYIRAIRVGDLKLDTFQRLLCSKTLPIFSQFSFKTLSHIWREKAVQRFQSVLRGKSPKDIA